MEFLKEITCFLVEVGWRGEWDSLRPPWALLCAYFQMYFVQAEGVGFLIFGAGYVANNGVTGFLRTGEITFVFPLRKQHNTIVNCVGSWIDTSDLYLGSDFS